MSTKQQPKEQDQGDRRMDHGKSMAQDPSAQGGDREHGEGNYKASRDFDEAERAFVQSGKVDEAARNAAPKSEAEEREIIEAENKARKRAKEEDPALLKKRPRSVGRSR